MAETIQRGSGWSIGRVLFLYRLFGYQFIYYLMYPVTFFYFIFAGNVKASLRIYYAHLGLPFNNRVYYTHLRTFAVCMVDRFITRIDPESYTYLYENREIPREILRHASILLQSHFGGWAASSNSSNIQNRLNIVMREVMLKDIKKIENSIESKRDVRVIDLNRGTISASVQIANALLDDEVVAMMGDRAATEKAEIEIDFLGETARFNKSPFQIAYKMEKPILVYFVILIGMRRYRVAYLKIEMDRSKDEEEAILEALRSYAALYEKIIREYPDQWFNFYDFWEKR